MTTRSALLSTRIRGRMPVEPDQVHLWTLALMQAWNELPAPRGGQGDVGSCVRLLLGGVAEGQVAEPGEAVLPSVIDLVAQGQWNLPLRRSTECPWRDDDLVVGARQAIRTVAEAAAVRFKE